MNSLLEGLNDKQTEAVLHDKGPLLILAGAGSGKTRVLTHRVAYLIAERGVSPYSIIALTFTNKAAKEMRERVEKIVGHGAENIWVSTFHSSCVRILRRFIDTIGYGRDFVIYDTDDQKSVMKDVFKALSIDPKRLKEKTVLSVISHAKDELIDPDRFELEAGADKMLRTYAACYREYQKRLRINNALDFDDLIFRTIELFENNRDALEYYRRRFIYIMVDEYQDTNSAQFRLISLLANHTNDEGIVEHNLCVVGDDDQSIYRFRGANIHNILDFEKTYPETITIKLEENYRSTSHILDVANEVIQNNAERKSKKLWTRNGEGDFVELHYYPSDRDEADGVICEIAAGVREGFREYGDYAILYRTNAQSRIFEEKLIYRNIPYKIIGGQNFYQRKEIKDMLAYLRTIAGTQDSMAVKRIINVPKRGIGAATIEKLDAYAEEHECSFYDALRSAPFVPGVERAVPKLDRFVSLIESLRSRSEGEYALPDLIDEILEATQYIDWLSEDDEPDKVEERISNINELISKMTDYADSLEEGTESPTLAGFLDEVALVADVDSMDEGGDNRVLLMTVHSAKGLEFPVVFMTGMEEGIFPGFMSINAENPEEEIEEERRLCYVGMTRAKEKLFLSSCSSRMMRGEIQENTESRFLKEIMRSSLKVSGDRRRPRLADDSFRSGAYGRFASSGSFSSGTDRYSSLGSREYTGQDRFPAPKRNTTYNLRDNPMKSGLSGLEGLVSKGIGGGSALKEPDYKVGDRVRHIKFGEGTVTELTRGTKDYEVTVRFESGVKKMLASFAKLTRL